MQKKFDSNVSFFFLSKKEKEKKKTQMCFYINLGMNVTQASTVGLICEIIEDQGAYIYKKEGPSKMINYYCIR